MDASAYKRSQLYKLLSDERPRLARIIRKLLGSQAPPAESEKLLGLQAVGLAFARIIRKLLGPQAIGLAGAPKRW